MTKAAQELLERLYKASQEERVALRKISDVKLVEEKQKTIELNDFARREDVDALMQELLIKNKLDYFHAAMIYSHGKTIADYKQAISYAEQALDANKEGELSKEANQQLRLTYELAVDKLRISAGKKPKYGVEKNQGKSDDKLHLKTTEGSMSKAISISPMDFDNKKNRDKKKEEEELKIRPVACSNCGEGHPSASCIKPKKKW